jgi:colanic acid/amylovoran biosynthesis protein
MHIDDENDRLVGIMGASLGTGNRGVSALGASLVKLITGAKSETDVTMLIGHRDSQPFKLSTETSFRTIPVVNYRLSPRSAPRGNLFVIVLLALLYRAVPVRAFRRGISRFCPWIGTVAKAQLVGDIRGGDSFSDIYGLRGFLLSSLPVITVIWVKGGIVLFPQTYGPYKHPLARLVARYILRRASVILSRDRESMDTVRQLIGPTDKLRFCPDVAFCLDAFKPRDLHIEPPLPSARAGPLVGLNVNGLMYNGGYTRQNMFGLRLDYRAFLQRLTVALLEQPSLHLLLVPHTFAGPDNVESDPQACREVMAAAPAGLRDRVHLVTHEYDQHEIKGVIGECDFFIGSRMHSCIAALSQGIPTIGVAYSKKFRGVFETVGAEDWVIDGRSTTAEGAVTEALSRFARRDEMREALAGRPAAAQVILRKTFASISSAPSQKSADVPLVPASR